MKALEHIYGDPDVVEDFIKKPALIRLRPQADERKLFDIIKTIIVQEAFSCKMEINRTMRLGHIVFVITFWRRMT